MAVGTVRAYVKSATTIEPKVAGAGIAGALSTLIVHLLITFGVHVPQTVNEYLPVALTLLGGYLTPSRKGRTKMATLAEIQAFLEAEVPADQVDAVSDKVRELGLDSTVSTDVAKALDAVVNPPAEQVDTQTAQQVEPAQNTGDPAPAAQALDVQQLLGEFAATITSALQPITDELKAIGERVAALETANPSPGSAQPSAASASVAETSGSTASTSPTEVVSTGDTEQTPEGA